MATKVLHLLNGDFQTSIADVRGTEAIQALIADSLIYQAIESKATIAEVTAELV